MPRIKTVHVPASPASSVNLTHNTDRGGPSPQHEPLRAIDKVVKLPFRQVTHADGTVTAPAWTPEGVDANLDGPRAANRSHADTVSQLNPYGDPTHARRMKPPQPAPAPVGIGGSVGTVRRKVVGASRNPVASVKPLKTPKAQDQGAFTPDEE